MGRQKIPRVRPGPHPRRVQRRAQRPRPRPRPKRPVERRNPKRIPRSPNHLQPTRVWHLMGLPKSNLWQSSSSKLERFWGPNMQVIKFDSTMIFLVYQLLNLSCPIHPLSPKVQEAQSQSEILGCREHVAAVDGTGNGLGRNDSEWDQAS